MSCLVWIWRWNKVEGARCGRANMGCVRSGGSCGRRGLGNLVRLVVFLRERGSLRKRRGIEWRLPRGMLGVSEHRLIVTDNTIYWRLPSAVIRETFSFEFVFQMVCLTLQLLLIEEALIRDRPVQYPYESHGIRNSTIHIHTNRLKSPRTRPARLPGPLAPIDVGTPADSSSPNHQCLRPGFHLQTARWLKDYSLVKGYLIIVKFFSKILWPSTVK